MNLAIVQIELSQLEQAVSTIEAAEKKFFLTNIFSLRSFYRC
jgi:hypothetical protein